jgi:hypothetical protein
MDTVGGKIKINLNIYNTTEKEETRAHWKRDRSAL